MSVNSLVSSKPVYHPLEAFPENALELLSHIAQNAFELISNPQNNTVSQGFLIRNNFEARPDNQKSPIQPGLFSEEKGSEKFELLQNKFVESMDHLPTLFVESFVHACRFVANNETQSAYDTFKEQRNAEIESIAARAPSDFPFEVARGRGSKAAYNNASQLERNEIDRQHQVKAAEVTIAVITDTAEQMGILFATQYRAKPTEVVPA